MKSNEYKVISRAERMNNKSLRTPVKLSTIEHFVHVKETIYDEVSKRFVSKLKKIKRNGNSLAKYKISDFALENLQLSGAIDNLTSSFSSLDRLTKLSNLQATAENIVNLDKKNNSNN